MKNKKELCGNILLSIGSLISFLGLMMLFESVAMGVILFGIWLVLTAKLFLD